MQVGKIEYYNLEKNFTNFYYEIAGHRWDYVTRVLHNQEQVMRCQLRDGTSNPKLRLNISIWMVLRLPNLP